MFAAVRMRIHIWSFINKTHTQMISLKSISNHHILLAHLNQNLRMQCISMNTQRATFEYIRKTIHYKRRLSDAYEKQRRCLTLN